MKCPVDGATLAMSSRDGVEIDYCPECRGVWLDRGELDKIIERASVDSVGLAQGSAGRDERARRDDVPRYDEGSRYDAPRRDERPRRDDDDYRGRGYDDRSRYGDRGYGDQRYGDHRKRKRKNFLEDLFDFD